MYIWSRKTRSLRALVLLVWEYLTVKNRQYICSHTKGGKITNKLMHTGASTRAASSGRAELVPEQVAAAGTELVISWQWQPPFRLQGADFAFPSWLKSMVDIYQLDISNSSISDSLPDWFCTLQCLCEGLVSEHLQLAWACWTYQETFYQDLCSKSWSCFTVKNNWIDLACS